MSSPSSRPNPLPFSTLALIETLKLALFAAFVGGISAYAAMGFVVGIDAVQTVLLGAPSDDVVSLLQALPAWQVVLAPAAGGLLVGLLTVVLFRDRLAQGPVDVVEAVHAHDGKMPLRRGLASALAAVVSVGAGASVGRYGPAVHLGATLGSWIGRYFVDERNARIALLGAGVAGAIAGAFNAPLAAILFAHEVVIRRFAARAVMPTVVGAAVGELVIRFHGGGVALFALPKASIDHLYEYWLFVPLGLLGGALAIAFMYAVDTAGRYLPRLPVPAWGRPAVGGFIIGLLALGFPEVFGLGEQVIGAGLRAEHALVFALALIPVKIFATSCSLGLGFYGGVLGPALFLGTMMGEAFGLGLRELFPAGMSDPTVYALAGMGVVVSRVVGAPIATILIVFELTSSYELTTAAMIAVVVASVVRSERFPGSLFQYQLTASGVETSQGREIVLLRRATLSERMRPPAAVAALEATIGEAVDELVRHGAQTLHVTDAHGVCLGATTLAALLAANDGSEAKTLASMSVESAPVFNLAMTVHEAMDAIVGRNADVVGIIDEDGRLRGEVRAVDLIEEVSNAVNLARSEEQAR